MRALLIVVFVFLLRGYAVFGQHSTANDPVRPADHSVENMDELEGLHPLADEWLVYAPDSLIRFGTMKKQMAEKDEDNAGATLLIALGHIRNDDYKRALHLLQEALDQYAITKYRKGQGDALFFIGVIHERKREYDLGVDCYLQSAKHYAGVKYEAGLGRVWNRLGEAYLKKKDPKRAIQYYLAGLLRGLVGCGWFGIQTWIGGEAIYALMLVAFPGLAASSSLGSFIGLNAAQAFCLLAFWSMNIWIIYRGIDTRWSAFGRHCR